MIRKLKKVDLDSEQKFSGSLSSYKDSHVDVLVDGKKTKCRLFSLNISFKYNQENRLFHSIKLLDKYFQTLGKFLFNFEIRKEIREYVFTDEVKLLTHTHLFDYLQGDYIVDVNGESVVFTVKKLNEHLRFREVYFEISLDTSVNYNSFIFTEAQRVLLEKVIARADSYVEGLAEHFNLMIDNQEPMLKRTFKIFKNESLIYSSIVNILEDVQISDFGEFPRDSHRISFKRNMTLSSLDRVNIIKREHLGYFEAIIKLFIEKKPELFSFNDENPIFKLEGEIPEKGLINVKTFMMLKEKYSGRYEAYQLMNSLKEIQ